MGTSKLVLEDLLLFLAFGTKFFEKFRFELGYSMKGLQYEFLSSKSHPTIRFMLRLQRGAFNIVIHI